MLAVRGLQRLKPVLSQHGNTGLRRVSAASNVVQHKEDMLVKMENPYKEPEKGCLLCNVTVDYKNIQSYKSRGIRVDGSWVGLYGAQRVPEELLSQFISPHTGRIYGRHITGLCGRKQKEVSKAIKKAHSMGFMSVTHKHPQFMRDPNICGVKRQD